MTSDKGTQDEGGVAQIALGDVLQVIREEMERQHKASLGIQETLAAITNHQKLSATEIVNLQALDALTQTLENLEALLQVVAQKPTPQQPLSSLVARASLQSLRGQLLSRAKAAHVGLTGTTEPEDDDRLSPRSIEPHTLWL